MHRFRQVAVAAVILLTLLIPTPRPVTAAEVQAAIDERAVWGLETDPALVRSLLASYRLDGTTEFGVPATGAELEAIEFSEQIQFQADVQAELVPFIRSLSTYAGAYFDLLDEGKLVILLTARDAAREQEIGLKVPLRGPGVRFEVRDHSYAALADALVKVPEAWSRHRPDIPLHAVALDTVANSVRLEVALDLVAEAQAAAKAIGDELGVPITAIGGVAPTEAVQDCTSRANCHDPMEAGIKIHNTQRNCTMGFHIVWGGDRQFFTAGHCGHGNTPALWKHAGCCDVGVELQTWYWQGGEDVMRVQMVNAQASNDIYGSTRQVIGYGFPVTNSSVCMSLAFMNTIDCGTVTDDFMSYGPGGTACGCTLFGASFNSIAWAGGDSGAPAYALTGTNNALAIGGLAIGFTATTGAFARIGGILQNNGATVVSS